jgi:DNA-binding MarR family transcriptional regulator
MSTTASKVLAHLARAGDPPTASEVAHAIGVRAATVATVLRNLATAGHVKQLGGAFSGARTWTLTDAGRQVLASADTKE